jgi:hypothetical protein
VQHRPCFEEAATSARRSSNGGQATVGRMSYWTLAMFRVYRIMMEKVNLGILVKREKLRKPPKIAHNKLHKSINIWRLKIRDE